MQKNQTPWRCILATCQRTMNKKTNKQKNSVPGLSMGISWLILNPYDVLSCTKVFVEAACHIGIIPMLGH